LSRRCLATAVSSGSTISPFRWRVTIYIRGNLGTFYSTLAENENQFSSISKVFGESNPWPSFL
jgi:hypothetical protein